MSVAWCRFCTIAFLFCFAAPAFGDDWPQFRGPRGDGTSAEKNLPSEPVVLWKTPLAGDGCSSPVVSNGRVYVTTAFPADESEVADTTASLAATLLAAIALTVLTFLSARLLVSFVFSRRAFYVAYLIAVIGVTVLAFAKPMWFWPFADPWSGTVMAEAQLAWLDTYLLRPVVILFVGLPIVFFTRRASHAFSEWKSGVFGPNSLVKLIRSMTFATAVCSLASVIAAAFLTLRPEWFFQPGQPWLAWLVSGGIAHFMFASAVGWLPEAGNARNLAAALGLAAAVWLCTNTPNDQFAEKLDSTVRIAMVTPGTILLICHEVVLVLARWTKSSNPSLLLGRWTAFIALTCLAIALFVRCNYLRPEVGLTRAVICIDAKSGHILWTTPVFSANAEKTHVFSSHATPTPATDGEHVYAYFGSGLAALDKQGAVKWLHRDPDYHRFSRYGTGSSLTLSGELIIVYRDSEFAGHGDHLDDDITHQEGRRASLLIAFDKRTGAERWRVSPEFSHDSYMTPLVWSREGQLEVVVATWKTVAGFDLRDGKLRWKHEHPMQQIVPSVAVHRDTLFITGGNLVPSPIYAIRAPTKDNVSRTLWFRDKGGSSMASPVCWNGRVHSISHVGVMTSRTGDKGELVWSRRVGRRYLGSPIVADDKLYMLDQEGTLFILAASDGQVLHERALDETCAATPAIADGCVYIRTTNHLWCFGAAEKAAGR
jgi:outer membrane protein assembly factor BamB